MVVVEGATRCPFVAEYSTMVVIGLIISLVGMGFLCWLVFTLAVYALPFFAGMTAGLAAYQTGAGVIGALMVGLVAGALTLVAGQAAFAAVRSPIARGTIAILFAVPAAIAGYHATRALAQIGVPSTGWREVFAIVGAITVGGTALVRVAAMAHPPVGGRGVAVAQDQSRMTATTRGV